MKIGIRTPSPEKSIKARTTGRIKRKAKSSINPFYGKKGMGYLKDPERAIKNKVYHELTIDPLDEAKSKIKTRREPSKAIMIPIILFYILGIILTAATEFIFLSYKSFNVYCAVGAIISFVLYVVFYERKYG